MNSGQTKDTDGAFSASGQHYSLAWIMHTGVWSRLRKLVVCSMIFAKEAEREELRETVRHLVELVQLDWPPAIMMALDQWRRDLDACE